MRGDNLASHPLPMPLKSLCVYCGSAVGTHPSHAAAARDLGGLLAARGIALVYGGGGIGLMGEVARAVLAGGGSVTGVIPEHLNTRERAFHHPRVELRITRTMHERKTLMADLADGFIALSGGIGTFDELFEILTWKQLGLHRKPVGLLNVSGYFDPLLALLDSAVREGFAPERLLSKLLSAPTAGELLASLEDARAGD